MRKICSCGRDIPFAWSLCSGCLEVYGGARSEWPKWLLFHVNDLNREMMANRRHDELTYNDEWNYASMRVPPDDGWGPYSDS